MSSSLDLFFNFPEEKELASRIAADLGVHLIDTSCDAHPFAHEFAFSSTQFWLSINDVDLAGSGLCDESFQFRIGAEIPGSEDLEAFSLVFATMVKTIHLDLLVDESLLVFSTQNTLAHLRRSDAGLIDHLGGSQLSINHLPGTLCASLESELFALTR